MKNYARKEIERFGNVCYFNEIGKLHRIDGPAIEYADGTKQWFMYGKRHRANGPAFEYPNGGKFWYINDFHIDNVKIDKLQKLRKTFNDDDLLNELLLSGRIIL